MLSSLRHRISEKIFSFIPPREASLVAGSVLGVDQIPAGFRNSLVLTGTIHVVVVSGQNLMILATILFSFSRYLGRRVVLVGTFLILILYASLAGFEVPVVRALIMVFLTLVAGLFGRVQGGLIGLFWAAYLIIFVWPRAYLEPSFQLSFAATLGIVTLGKALEVKLRRFKLLGQNAAVAVSAYLFTAPILMWHFGSVSAIAPFVNVLVSELVFPIMVLGFLAAVFALVIEPIAYLFSLGAFVFAYVFGTIVDLFSHFKFGFGQSHPSLIFVSLLYVLILFVSLKWSRKLS